MIHPGAGRVSGATDPRATLRVTVVLRPPAHEDGPHAERLHALVSARPHERRWLSRAELHALHDPGEDAFRRVARFAEHHGLRVVETSRARHDVVLEGAVRAFDDAFGVHQAHYEHEGRRYRAHDGPIHVPPELEEIVVGVLGLDDVPLGSGAGAGAPGETRGLSPHEIEEHYRFPAISGHTPGRIALLQFNGGFHASDVSAFLDRFGLSAPPIAVHEVPGASRPARGSRPQPIDRLARIADDWRAGTPLADLATRYGGQDIADFFTTVEVTMDVQIAAGLGAGAGVDVWFAPGGSPDDWRRTLFAALGEAHGVADGEDPALPAAISVSWGFSERDGGAMKLNVIELALQAAARRGVTVCCSTGDMGSSNSTTPVTQANVNFPASSPSVLACGGTTLRRVDGRVDSERAWKESLLGVTMATGGGMSGFFRQPHYQAGIVPRTAEGTWLADHDTEFVGRWIPDTAACAAFDPGVALVLGGRDFGGGGTSAATPIWAALVTRLSAALGHPIGLLNTELYRERDHGCCRAIVGGDNDVTGGTIAFYRAVDGWNACTGLGVPDGTRILERLRGV